MTLPYAILQDNPFGEVSPHLAKQRDDLRLALSSYLKEDPTKSCFGTQVAVVGGRGQGKSHLVRSVLRELPAGTIVGTVDCSTYLLRKRAIMELATSVRNALYALDGEEHTLRVQAVNFVRDAAARPDVVADVTEAVAGFGEMRILCSTLEHYEPGTLVTADVVQGWFRALLHDLVQQGLKVVLLLDNFDEVESDGLVPLSKIGDRVQVATIITTRENTVWALGDRFQDRIEVGPASPEYMLGLTQLVEPRPEVRDALLSGDLGEEVRWLSQVSGSPATFLAHVRHDARVLTAKTRDENVKNDAMNWFPALSEGQLVQLVTAFSSELTTRTKASLCVDTSERLVKEALRARALRRVDSRSDEHLILDELLFPLRALVEGR